MEMKPKTDLSILLLEDFELDSDAILSQLLLDGYAPSQIQIVRNIHDIEAYLQTALPDLIIYDLQVPLSAKTTLGAKEEDIRRGLNLLRRLTEQYQDQIQFIVLSRFPEPWIVYQVVACGVSFIDKYNYKDLLPWAIEQARRGHVVISSNVRPNLRKIFPLALRVGMDNDDVKIIRFIQEGKIDRDIADTMGYTEDGIATRLRKMYRAYGFRTREDLANWFRDFIEPITQFPE